jgi:hypothetical protein
MNILRYLVALSSAGPDLAALYILSEPTDVEANGHRVGKVRRLITLDPK